MTVRGRRYRDAAANANSSTASTIPTIFVSVLASGIWNPPPPVGVDPGSRKPRASPDGLRTVPELLPPPPPVSHPRSCKHPLDPPPKPRGIGVHTVSSRVPHSIQPSF